jgi:hypothetical protein
LCSEPPDQNPGNQVHQLYPQDEQLVKASVKRNLGNQDPRLPPLEVDCCVILHASTSTDQNPGTWDELDVSSDAKQNPGNQVIPDTSIWRLVVVWWYMHRDPNPGHQPKPGKLKGGQTPPFVPLFSPNNSQHTKAAKPGKRKKVM